MRAWLGGEACVSTLRKSKGARRFMHRSDPSLRDAAKKAMLRGIRRVCLLLLLLDAARPAAAQLTCAAPAKPMAQVELIFGSGRGVTQRSFMAFLAKEVTPRFPDGLSLFSGYGNWRNGKGRIIKETSRMLLIWYIPDAQSQGRIEAIRSAYKKRFHRQSVLRADSVSCVSF